MVGRWVKQPNGLWVFNERMPRGRKKKVKATQILEDENDKEK